MGIAKYVKSLDDQEAEVDISQYNELQTEHNLNVADKDNDTDIDHILN